MKLSELKSGQGKVDVEGTISDMGETRAFKKFDKELKVCNAKLTTADGESITLSLWNDEITRIKNGDSVKVINGYVSEFNGNKQLSAGKFGKIEVVGGEKSEVKETKKAVKKNKEEIEDKEF